MSSNWQCEFLALMEWWDFKEEHGNGGAESLMEGSILLSAGDGWWKHHNEVH